MKENGFKKLILEMGEVYRSGLMGLDMKGIGRIIEPMEWEG
jgi:hypothetical protein